MAASTIKPGQKKILRIDTPLNPFCRVIFFDSYPSNLSWTWGGVRLLLIGELIGVLPIEFPLTSTFAPSGIDLKVKLSVEPVNMVAHPERETAKALIVKEKYKCYNFGIYGLLTWLPRTDRL